MALYEEEATVSLPAVHYIDFATFAMSCLCCFFFGVWGVLFIMALKHKADLLVLM